MKGLGRFFSGKKVFLSGHTGFKGSWLSYILLGMGSSVVGYSLRPAGRPNLFSALGLGRRMKSVYADIRSYPRLLRAMKEESPDIVVHMAAQPLVRESYARPRYTHEANLMGTVNMLEAMREAGCARAGLFITTDKVYENAGLGRPFREEDALGGHDPYSASKACADIAVRSYSRSFFESSGVSVATARAGNVLGGGDWSQDRIVPDIVRSFLGGGPPLVLRRPGAVRPWQHVLDPLRGYLMLAKRLHEGGCSGAWNFAPAEKDCITVREIAGRAVKAFGKGSFREEPDESGREMETLRLDAAKAREKLGWKPLLGIDGTLDWTFGWYRDYYAGKDAAGLTNAQLERFMELAG